MQNKLKFKIYYHELSEDSVKMQILLEKALWVYISNRLPGDATAAGGLPTFCILSC